MHSRLPSVDYFHWNLLRIQKVLRRPNRNIELIYGAKLPFDPTGGILCFVIEVL